MHPDDPVGVGGGGVQVPGTISIVYCMQKQR